MNPAPSIKFIRLRQELEMQARVNKREGAG